MKPLEKPTKVLIMEALEGYFEPISVMIILLFRKEMISELYPIVGTGLMNSGWSVILKKMTVLPDLESPPITILIWSGRSEHIRQPIYLYYNLF